MSDSSKAMRLKAKIRNLAKDKNITAQVILQNYMFEGFLERLSCSKYKNNFILKGGMVIAAIVGLDNRSTMDLDATLRKIHLNEENIRTAISNICAIEIGDGTNFTLDSIGYIRADDIYGGYRVGLTAQFDTIKTPLTMDISTGDIITPQAIKFSFHGIFDQKKKIELWAYNLETIMAEKLETILSRNIFNTRSRDFYDIYILSNTQSFNIGLLREAISATATHRGTEKIITNKQELFNMISKNKDLQDRWLKYQHRFNYASNVTWEKVMIKLALLCDLELNPSIELLTEVKEKAEKHIDVQQD